MTNSLNISSAQSQNSLVDYGSSDSYDSCLEENNSLLNIACTNARSIVEKIKSLITLFEENGLHIAILTEAWLTSKSCPVRAMNDLTIGANLNFVRRDRGRRGGGVAICYDPTKIRMNRFRVQTEPNNKTEIICAAGNSNLTKRKIVAVALYLPPSLTASELNIAVQTLTDTVDQVFTSFPDAIVFVGGDFNKKNISQFTSTFPSLKPLRVGATRRGAYLDEIYTNIWERMGEKRIQMPLSKEDGTLSDHSVVAASFKLPRQPKSVPTTFSFRPITSEGIDKFRSLIVPYDWSQINLETPTLSAAALQTVLQDFISKSFPCKTRTVRNTDAPWLSRRTKELINRKKRIFKSEGKTQKYFQANNVSTASVKKDKEKYLEKVIVTTKETNNSRSFYKAVKNLQTKEAQARFDVSDLYPGKSEHDVAETVAEYFNKISLEYNPLPDPQQQNLGIVHVEPYQVSARLKSFKKPRSQVEGDISPELVNLFHDLLAIPLCNIYNQTLNMLSWPELWKC